MDAFLDSVIAESISSPTLSSGTIYRFGVDGINLKPEKVCLVPTSDLTVFQSDPRLNCTCCYNELISDGMDLIFIITRTYSSRGYRVSTRTWACGKFNTTTTDNRQCRRFLTFRTNESTCVQAVEYEASGSLECHEEERHSLSQERVGVDCHIIRI